jgi:hypothetical protein
MRGDVGLHAALAVLSRRSLAVVILLLLGGIGSANHPSQPTDSVRKPQVPLNIEPTSELKATLHSPCSVLGGPAAFAPPDDGIPCTPCEGLTICMLPGFWCASWDTAEACMTCQYIFCTPCMLG